MAPTLSEINVVPMVDVMLVLLIIFMVAAPMLQRGVEVNLPVASRSQEIASERVFVDVEMSAYNPFPFMPMRDGSRWDPIKGASQITRLSADLSKKSPKDYQMEVLYPGYFGALPRQDDRYHTAHYRYGYLPCPNPAPKDTSKRPNACWARFDHQTRKGTVFDAGEGTTLAEVVFAPKSKTSPEGVGYLMGVATRNLEGGRSDLIILDAERPEAGPIATVKLPIRAVGQIHGLWVPDYQLKTA